MQTKLNLVKGISQKELPDIMVASGEGVVALDQQGCVSSVDAGAVRILGWPADEIIGQDFFTFSNFAHGDLAALGVGTPCPAINTVQCPHLNRRASLSRKDGVLIDIDFMMTSLLDAGRISGKLFVFSEHVPPQKPVAQQLVDAAASLVVKLNADGEVDFCNPHCQWLLGEENVETLVPDSIRTLLAQQPHQLDQQTLLDKRWLEGQEKELCIVWSVSVMHNAAGEVVGAVCIGNDFTDHNHSLKGQLHESMAVQKIFESLNDGVITVDLEGRVIYLNRVAEQLTGWTRSEVQGRSLRDVYHVVDELSLEGGDDLVSLCLQSGNSISSDGNRVLIRRGGWEFIVQDTATPVHDTNNEITGAVLVFTDISELRGMERWMEYESSHDSLTGLINRQELEDRLQNALDSVGETDQHHVLCYLDLDQFRLINDTHGHAAGDKLLKEISLLLKECLGDGDSLARLGGDEFGAILKNQDISVARRAAKSMCRAVRDFYYGWGNRPFEVSVSIGLVPITSQWLDRAEILRVAASACDVAKDMGRNRVHTYEPRDLALRQREVEMRWIYLIRRALNENRFQLYYQNIVPLSKNTGQGTHYEILLRMVADDGSIISPSEFIAAAERYHLMPAVDRWVVTQSLKLLRQRRINGEVSGMFAINLSGQSLDDEEFLDFVVDRLHETATPPEMVCFEITETVAVTHLDVVQKFLSVLRKMGCRFALDDFGRGISSFAYLKNLNVDYLKIDGMFVQKIADNEIDHAMVESINHIGHIMGMQTIAEFVESQEVLEKLIDLGVDHVQGYQLGRPQPLRSAYQPVAQIN